MNTDNLTLVMLPQEQWADLIAAQQTILQELKELKLKSQREMLTSYLTAMQFMSKVQIGRTKFDQLVQSNKIKVIKKRRKIYVPISEVDRYFKDNDIQ